MIYSILELSKLGIKHIRDLLEKIAASAQNENASISYSRWPYFACLFKHAFEVKSGDDKGLFLGHPDHRSARWGTPLRWFSFNLGSMSEWVRGRLPLLPTYES
jgi:hypothetical protein